MNKKHNRIKHKVFYVFENWIIFLILLFFITYTISNYFFSFSVAYQDFIEVRLSGALFSLKGSLLSVAAIFIGVYVTVFTLLGSIKVDSIFAYLNEYTFKKLISYIRNAFIASFGYLILIMVLEISFDNYKEIYFWLIVLNASIVIYMFLTAFRFGIILYVAFSKDLEDLQNNIQAYQEEKKKIEQLKFKLEKFLYEFEKEQNDKQNKKMDQIIKHDKKEDT